LKSSTLTPEQKEEMKEVLKVIYKYDQFIDENPDVQERVERSRAQGEILGLQKAAMAPIKKRFPALLAQVQPLIEQIQKPDKLEELVLQLASATTEQEVRQILQIKKASRRRKQ
jgi:hypothetical protein